jgi:molybdenum cofactor guanylyltransferase
MLSSNSPVGGIVLCGGESRRMGRSKALLPFGPETMVERTVRIVQQVVSPVIVVGAQGQSLPKFASNVRVLHDEIDAIGPLGGLCTGLAALRTECELAFVTACDTPFLDPQVIRYLVDSMGDHDLVIPREGDYYHPLTAVYRTRLEQDVRQLVQAGRYRPAFLIETANTRQIDVELLRTVDPDLKTLRNLNTEADYREALSDAGFKPDGMPERNEV